MYFDFKLRNNLSEQEILKKSKSLRSSMHLFSEQTAKNLLKKTGFSKQEVFKCLNFIGYVAIK